MQVAVDSGVKVVSGLKVESANTENTTILLADEAKDSADLIIAADGLHSTVRYLVIDTTRCFPKRSTGQSAIRFMLSKSVAQNDSIVSTVVNDDDSHMQRQTHSRVSGRLRPADQRYLHLSKQSIYQTDFQ